MTREQALQPTDDLGLIANSAPPADYATHLTPRAQTQLRVGAVDDPLEHEADRMADAVMASVVPAAAVDHSAVKGGALLSPSLRAYFEPRFGADFSAVRLHTGASANAAARDLEANAFVVGGDIGFATQAVPLRTLAHELAHVAQVQLGADDGVIRRDINENALSTTSAETIMSDSNYFENGIERIEFFSAELARLHYLGGRHLDIGLVPEWIRSPLEAVDYRTERSAHLPVAPPGVTGLGTGAIRFIPKASTVRAPAGTTLADVDATLGRTIRFVHDQASGRIVPTEVNSISAPRLCAALRGAEAEYVRRTNEIAAGMVQTLHTFEWIIMLESIFGALAETSAARAAARVAPAAAGVGVIGRAAGVFERFFLGILRTPTVAATGAEITVEGVGVGGVNVVTRGTELFVSRSSILNIGRVAGQGRLVHSAFEMGAIQAARAAGMTTARVGMSTVVNATWRAYLEAAGYSSELIQVGPNTWTNFMTKVFSL